MTAQLATVDNCILARAEEAGNISRWEHHSPQRLRQTAGWRSLQFDRGYCTSLPKCSLRSLRLAVLL
jgi:hypothetical protein